VLITNHSCDIIINHRPNIHFLLYLGFGSFLLGLIPGLVIGVCCGYKLWHNKVQTHPVMSNNLPPSPLVHPRFLPPMSDGPVKNLAPTNFPPLHSPLPPLNQINDSLVPLVPQYPPILPPIALPPLIYRPPLPALETRLPPLPHLAEPKIPRTSVRKRHKHVKKSAAHQSKAVVVEKKSISSTEDELNSTDVLYSSEVDNEMDIPVFEDKSSSEEQPTQKIYDQDEIHESLNFPASSHESDQFDMYEHEQNNVTKIINSKMESQNKIQDNCPLHHKSDTSVAPNYHLENNLISDGILGPTQHHYGELKDYQKIDCELKMCKAKSLPKETERNQEDEDGVSTKKSLGDQSTNVDVTLADTIWPQTLD